MNFPAFEMSPVPVPGPNAVAPQPFRGIYGMPMFVIVPCADIAKSVEFWVEGLGFFDFFTAPGQVTHLRRWAFQDVLLVPGAQAEGPGGLTVSFSCVLDEIDGIAEACERAVPGCTVGPRVMPWNSMELEVVTPEHTRVVMTAARPYDPASPAAEHLRSMGIEGP
ncbi:glycosyltransferase [Nocardia coubleae]|uniref:VOC family protein n=1 Tax=Nocardia coubleae TaxID=356147 RepID=A0A846W8Q1_9NOCA|nr:glycosyltransferase [Nocardia coubleae]NKX89772.1 VOC family protein [Nocardia coubleae]